MDYLEKKCGGGFVKQARSARTIWEGTEVTIEYLATLRKENDHERKDTQDKHSGQIC